VKGLVVGSKGGGRGRCGKVRKQKKVWEENRGKKKEESTEGE